MRLRSLFLKGLALANVPLKEVSKILGIKQSEIRAEYNKLLKLSPAEKLELIMTEPSDNNKKFLKLCFYGGERFIRYFFGMERISPRDLVDLLLKVESDPAILSRLAKISLEFDKLELQKAKEEKKGVKDIEILLDKLSQLIEPSDLETWNKI